MNRAETAYESLSQVGQEFIVVHGPDALPTNRSAEHRLGKFLNSSKRAEAVLGAPTARFMAREPVRKELEIFHEL